MSFNHEQARQDLNPQPAVLETAALPIELLAFNSQDRPDTLQYLILSRDARYASGNAGNISSIPYGLSGCADFYL